MQISSQPSESFTVVHIEGNLDTNTAPDAQAHIDQLQDDGTQKIVVNFEDVDYVSSAGLRVLLATAKRLGASGGDLRICGLNEMVNEVFEMSGFSMILNVFGTESEAIEGL